MVNGFEVKVLYIIDISTIYGFHPSPPANIHWKFYVYSIFFLSVYHTIQYGGGGGVISGVSATLMIPSKTESFTRCTDKKPGKI